MYEIGIYEYDKPDIPTADNYFNIKHLFIYLEDS